ncbi:MAG: hypothetical protein ACK2TV_02440, partial [Anaerolineales bacterium]
SLEGKIGGFSIYHNADSEDILPEQRVILVPDVGVFSYAEDLIKAVQQVELLEWICSVNLGLG